MKAYLGIDVSKGYADMSLMNEQMKPLEDTFRLDDTRKGHDALRKMLNKSIALHGLEQVCCGVESTGGLENNWYGSLVKWRSEMPVEVARLNPLGIKHYAQAELNRNITDALSSRHIAGYMISHPSKVDYTVQDQYYASFRSLHKHILLLKRQKNQLVNELRIVVYSSFPELMSYCKSGIAPWVLEILINYPSTAALSKVHVSTLCKIKGVTNEKAQKLKDRAKSSVASRDNVAQQFLISSLAQQVRQKQQDIEAQKDFLIQNCNSQEVALLKSMIGVASYTAVAVMIGIEDIRRFSTPKQLASYFGLHPVSKSSGDRSSSCLSKKGRSTLRSVLYMPAHTAVMHDPYLKAIYDRHRTDGMVHRQVIVLIMHKMLRMMHGILSSNKPYDTKVDLNNQDTQVSERTRTNQHSEVARRLQEEDADAPVSRIESKRRKVLAASQVCKAERERDHPPTPVAKVKNPQQSNAEHDTCVPILVEST